MKEFTHNNYRIRREDRFNYILEHLEDKEIHERDHKTKRMIPTGKFRKEYVHIGYYSTMKSAFAKLIDEEAGKAADPGVKKSGRAGHRGIFFE